MNDFLQQLEAHLKGQNTTLAQYEQFFARVQEIYPTYAEFVQQVSESLVRISENMNSLEAALAQSKEQRAVQVNVQPEVEPSEESLPRASKKTKTVSVKSNVSEKKVLIVDDAEINRVLMSHFFKALPVKLEFAMSGEQAISKIESQPFDLILMDLQMKGMSGTEAIQAIRKTHQTQIVAITNQEPSETEREQVMQSGANHYLSKSMTREELREKVIQILWNEMIADTQSA